MKRLLCWLGIHDWMYTEDFRGRSCVRCWREEVIVESEADWWRRGKWELSKKERR